MHEILCTLTLSRQKIKASNAFSGMYIDTVNMHVKKYDTLDFICLFIMLTLSIQHLQNIINLMVLMLTQLIQLNYSVNPNTKYSNYTGLRIKCSN